MKLGGAGLRVLRWGVWILLAWVLVRGVVSFLPASRTQAAEPQKTDVKSAAEPAGLRAFPEMFTREYLTWQPANPDERAERLKPFLAGSLDRQAGWTGKEGAGQAVENAWVYGVKQLSDTRWLVTVAARAVPYQEGVAAAPAPASPAGSAPAAPAAPVGRKTLPARLLFLAVPVSATGAGGWVVYDYPSLVPAPPRGEFTGPPFSGQTVTDKGDLVKGLLNGFFKAYLEGSDVTYYLMPNTKLPTMSGSWTFDSLGNVNLLNDSAGYLGVADVRAVDAVTGARFTYRYTLGLAEKDGRWYIKDLLQKGE
ncbi:MAG TPA: conjugal transfer protein [Symbiobacteriaceae bacterium]|jgi:hypothetical protein